MTLERVRCWIAWSVRTPIPTLTLVLPISLNKNLNLSPVNPPQRLSQSLRHPKGIILAKTNQHPFNLYLWPSSQLPQVTTTTSQPSCTPFSIEASAESECEEVDVEIVDEVGELQSRLLPQDDDIQEVYQQTQPPSRLHGRFTARRKVSQVLTSVVSCIARTKSWFWWYKAICSW